MFHKIKTEISSLPAKNWVLFVSILINRSGFMVMPFLTIYMTRHLGFTSMEAGTIVACYGLAAFAVTLPAGALMNRISPVTLMRVAMLGGSACLAVLPFLKTYWTMLAGVCVYSCFCEIFRPSNLVVLRNGLDTRQAKIAISINRWAINLGVSIGPAIGGFLVGINFKLIFFVNAVGYLASFFVLLHKSMEESRAQMKPSGDKNMFRAMGEPLRDNAFLLILLMMVPTEIAFWFQESTLSLFVTEHLGWSAAFFGSFYTVNTLLICVFEVPLNVWMVNMDSRKQIVLGALLLGLGWAGMGMSGTKFLFIMAYVVFTFGEMIYVPSATALASDYARGKNAGAYMSVYSSHWTIAIMLAPLIGNGSYSAFGPHAPMVLAFAFCMTTSIWQYVNLRRALARSNQETVAA